MCKLTENLCAMLVDWVRDHPVLRHDRVVKRGLDGAPEIAVLVNDVQRHDDERNAAFRAFGEVGGLLLGRHSVGRETCQMRGHHHAVPEFNVTDAKRAQEMFE